jgi:hypothetical protein
VTRRVTRRFAVPAGRSRSHGLRLRTHLRNSGSRSRFATNSSNCTDRNNPTCTSFDQLNLTTAQGAVTLKKASACALNITGGTETGHASGTYSHWNGYKLDYSKYTCIGNHIHNGCRSCRGASLG